MMLKKKLQNYNKAKKLKENKSYSLYIGLAKRTKKEVSDMKIKKRLAAVGLIFSLIVLIFGGGGEARQQYMLTQ